MANSLTYEKIGNKFFKTYVQELVNIDSEIGALEAQKTDIERAAKDDEGNFVRQLTAEEQALVDSHTAALAVLRS